MLGKLFGIAKHKLLLTFLLFLSGSTSAQDLPLKRASAASLAKFDSYSIRMIRPWEIGCNEFLHSVAVDKAGRVFTVTPDVRAVYWFDGTNWYEESFSGVPRQVFSDVDGSILLCASDGLWRLVFDRFGQLSIVRENVKFIEKNDKTLLYATIESEGSFLFNHHMRVRIDQLPMVAELSPEGYSYADTNLRASLLISKRDRGGVYLHENGQSPVPIFQNKEVKLEGAKFYDDQIIFAWSCAGAVFVSRNGTVGLFSETLEKKLRGARVFSIRKMSNGNVGITSTKGFFECSLDGQIQTIIDRRDGLDRDLVFRFVEAGEALWLTGGKSLVRLDPRRDGWEFRLTDGSTRVHDVVEKNGEFYFSTDYGCHVLSLEGGVDVSVLDITGISCPTYTLAQRRDGEVVAASTSGIYLLDGSDAKLLLSGRFYSLLEMSEDLYLTSDHQGTVHLIDARTEKLTKHQGPKFPFEVRYLYRLNDNLVLVVGWNGDWAKMEFDSAELTMAPLTNEVESVLICPVQFQQGGGFLFRDGIWRAADGINTAFGSSSSERFGVLFEWLQNRAVKSLSEVTDHEWLVTLKDRIVLLRVDGNGIQENKIWYLAGEGKIFNEYDHRSETFLCVNNASLIKGKVSLTGDVKAKLESPLIQTRVNQDELVDADYELLLNPRGGAKFSFSHISDSIPSRLVEYQSRLVGFSDEWSEWSQDQQREYTNLPGGDFEFQVRSRVGDGIVSTISTVRFRVLTPWYLTWPSRVATAFLGIVFVVGAVRFRSRRLLRAKLRMEELVKKRTSELEDERERVREKSEELLSQSRRSEVEKLESLSRTMGGIAHDFNNLLQVVLVNCELLEPSVDEAQKASVRAIRGAQSAAAALCSQLQVVSGTMPCVQEYVDLNSEVEKARDLFGVSFQESFQLAFQLATLTGKIYLEPIGFQQLILNLLFNAWEAKSSEIRVSTGCGYLDEEMLCLARATASDCRPGDYQWVEVLDNGSGIDQVTLSNMFDPFYSTKGLGRGLGLSVVLRVIRRNGGVLFVDSRSGQDHGTSFRICFPCIGMKLSESASIAKLPQAKSHRYSVALLDDDFRILEGLTACLELYGHDVFAASTPTGLYEHMETDNSSDVVMLDISMPLERGDSVARNLMTSGFRGLIYLMSGFSEDRIDESLLADPQIRFLAKPFSFSQFLETLDQEIENWSGNEGVRRPRFLGNQPVKQE